MNISKPVRRFLVAGALLAASAGGACSDITFEGGGPASLTLSADASSVNTGVSVNFEFQAVGSLLSGLVVEYGDGVADTVDMSGAQTAAGRLVHAFESPGSYTVAGTLFDDIQGRITDEVVIQVNPDS